MTETAHIPLLILDQFYKPKWKKEALETLKGGRRFLNYKRDLLEDDRIAEIGSRLKDLKAAIAKRDQVAVKEASKQLVGTCEHSLKSYRRPSALAENIEVFFVAIAVALGIRAYYVQPFRIPTGSMQPTLNGIIGHPISDPEWKKPNLLVQGFHKITEGRTYVKAVSEWDTEIVGIRDKRMFWFFTKTDILLANGEKIRINGSPNSIVNGLGVGKNMGFYSQTTTDGTHYFFLDPAKAISNGFRPKRFRVKKGQVIGQGYVDTGDLVLVNKFSYHFRNPKRGEIFVFETRGIEQISSDARLADQEQGSHYIKRLAGVPRDELRISDNQLWHNGKLAKEKGFQKVSSMTGGYHGYVHPKPFTVEPKTRRKRATFLSDPTKTVTLGEDEYFAMGDNSANSSDSRYWGTIDEYLLVGSGLFTLWPFENFGFMR